MHALKSLFKKKRKNSSEINSVNLVGILYTELEFLLSPYVVHFELKSKLKLFKKYSAKKKQDSFPGIYLDVEDFLLLQKEYAIQNKDTFRAEILKTYPLIKEYRALYAIFLDTKIQRVSLSMLFLKEALLSAKTLIGNFYDPFLREAEENLKHPFAFHKDTDDSEIASKLKELYVYSETLQNKLEQSLGQNAMLSIYNNAYNKHFGNYYLLESFTTIINLVPEELLIRENVNLPSKGQMHRLLKTQIATLEEINTKLSKEVLERKNIQKELEINERLYAAVLHNSLNANIIIDKEGTIVRWNAKAQELFIEGKNLYPLLPQKLSEELQNKIQNFTLKEIDEVSKDSFNFEVEENDTISYYTLKTSPIFVDEKILFFCVIEDITKEKKSLSLIEEAKDIAIKSSQAKTTFLSNMSHEIRTPLNVILGLSELFTKDTFEGSKREFENIEVIKFSAENLLTLVNDILDFSKIEAGKMTVQKVDFNFHEVIENVTKGFSLKAKEQGIKYTTVIDKKAPKFIVGDQFRLGQILNNLLSNAIKFTREGGVTLNIILIDSTEGTIKIRFEIIDTGIGISLEDTQHIFESFYQTINEKGEKPGGTGLGLTITKQLVSLLGGSLQLQSIQNKGTTFTFEIPFGLSELTENDSAKRTEEFEKMILKDKHILVAEDNKLNQLFITQLLTKWNAKVTIAQNGEDAVRMAKKERYDLILMDVHMPVLNGFEATQQIRAIEDNTINTIPIVACSADVFPESRKQAEDAGVDFYITKPINKDSIRDILFLFTR